jgi:hypothetical protein
MTLQEVNECNRATGARRNVVMQRDGRAHGDVG